MTRKSEADPGPASGVTSVGRISNPSSRPGRIGNPSYEIPTPHPRESRVDVPDDHGTLVAAAGRRLAVGGEGDGVDRTDLPLPGGELLAADRVPQPHRAVGGAAQEGAPVRGEGDGLNTSLVAAIPEEQFA